MQKEAKARIKINKLLEQSGWRFFDDEKGKANIVLENNVKITRKNLDEFGNDFKKTKNGFTDFLLLDEKSFPFVIVEAKSEYILEAFESGIILFDPEGYLAKKISDLLAYPKNQSMAYFQISHRGTKTRRVFKHISASPCLCGVYRRSSAVQIILKSYEWYYISENRQMKVKKC